MLTEVLLTIDSSNQNWSASLVDFSTGAQLQTFKTKKGSIRCAIPVWSDYLFGINTEKPLISVWSFQGKEQEILNFVSPGKLSLISTSSDGIYIAAVSGATVYIWHTLTGCMLRSFSKHYEAVNCIQFTDDLVFLITAGNDGNIFVYQFQKLLDAELPESQLRPFHALSAHAMAVSSICIGRIGCHSRLASCSADKTCKLWCLLSGKLLLTVRFEVTLTVCCLDPTESTIFVGSADGNIHLVSLTEFSNCRTPPAAALQDSLTFESSKYGFYTLAGHEAGKRINGLQVAMDGQTLVSAGDDCAVRVWDVPSRQCVRSMNYTGPVVQCTLLPTPRYFLNGGQQYQPATAPKPLQRQGCEAQRLSDASLLNAVPCRQLADTHSPPPGNAPTCSSPAAATRALYDFCVSKLLQ